MSQWLKVRTRLRFTIPRMGGGGRRRVGRVYISSFAEIAVIANDGTHVCFRTVVTSKGAPQMALLYS